MVIKKPSKTIIFAIKLCFIDNSSGVAGKHDSLKFQLIDEPPLGSWKISADVGLQKVEKFFTVEKYGTATLAYTKQFASHRLIILVLPKFDVTVKPPPYLSDKDDAVITVVSKYLTFLCPQILECKYIIIMAYFPFVSDTHMAKELLVL